MSETPEINEPVHTEYGHKGGMVYLLVVGANTGKTYWHLKYTPEHARYAAQCLTLNSIRAEENPRGGI
jgi:hypothetical protein